MSATQDPVPLPADSDTAHQPLSSWYTQGLSDGLGDRLLMFDNAATGPLELLRVRPDFSFVPEFEARLRRRFDELQPFAHPGFALARAVNHLDNGEGLTVVSTHVAGTRLSELFPASRAHAGMHPEVARWALGELTSAMAALHRQRGDVAHGALAPERVVITADRHVVITDYVFGDALAGMSLPPERLWTEFGVIGAPASAGVPLDQRADVVQIALVGMSLVLGRRVSPGEYFTRRTALLEDFGAVCDRQARGLSSGLRTWMERALDRAGFASAVEAEAALRMLTGPAALHGSRVSLPAPADARRAELPATTAALPSPPAAALPAYIDETAGSGAPERTRFGAFQWAVAALAVIGIVQGAIIAGLVFRSPASQASATPRITEPIAAPRGTDRQVGAASPGVLDLGAASPSAALSDVPAAAPPQRVRPGSVIAASETVRPTGEPSDLKPATSPAASGELRVIAPVAIDVREGGTLLGSSWGAPILVAPGVHDLELSNDAFGVRARQTVRVSAGDVVTMTVEAPDGRLSANAQPWAEVVIDGKAVGETPLANLPLAVGEHEVVFRHPQFGEQRQHVTVRAGALTRVSATLGPRP